MWRRWELRIPVIADEGVEGQEGVKEDLEGTKYRGDPDYTVAVQKIAIGDKIATSDTVQGISKKKAPGRPAKYSDCIVQELSHQMARVLWPAGASSLLARTWIRRKNWQTSAMCT